MIVAASGMFLTAMAAPRAAVRFRDRRRVARVVGVAYGCGAVTFAGGIIAASWLAPELASTLKDSPGTIATWIGVATPILGALYLSAFARRK